jgi:hypothetical protein
VDSVALKFPNTDSAFNAGDAQSTWAPVGDPAWSNTGLWHLPQGTYELCVSTVQASTVTQPPGDPQRWFLNGISLDQPWTSTNPVTTEITYAVPPASAEALPCECTPLPTTSVGTGEVQVTLTWHSAAACDLDLHVTEPSGETCSYSNSRTATGGQLDRDNYCSSYIDGRPENIFWFSAPAGTYKVKVNLFSDCGNSISSMGFDVRVVSGGSARTYSGTVSTAARTVEVTTFTVNAGLAGSGVAGPAHGQPDGQPDSHSVLGAGSRIAFGEPLGRAVATPDLPSKK